MFTIEKESNDILIRENNELIAIIVYSAHSKRFVLIEKIYHGGLESKIFRTIAEAIMDMDWISLNNRIGLIKKSGEFEF